MTPSLSIGDFTGLLPVLLIHDPSSLRSYRAWGLRLQRPLMQLPWLSIADLVRPYTT